MSVPLGPCICGHPAYFHGDRAFDKCLRLDSVGVKYVAPFSGGGSFYLYPTCGTCKGYTEDLGALHKQMSSEYRSLR